MTKKSTSWVTIPEEKIHTPVSSKKSKEENGATPVKNKIFWTAAFVLMVLVVTALLVPRQTASILQGNLFSQSGIEGADDVTAESMGIKPLTLIPVPEDKPAVSEETDDELVDEEETEEEVPEVENQTVVEAETGAINIQVDPVTIPVEPITEEKLEDQDSKPEESPIKVEPVVVADTEIKEELDANRKLLEELTKQISEFQEKDKQNNQALQDLTEIVKDEVIRPVANDNIPAATTTTIIGKANQPVVSSAGYRVNVHTVKLTPQQALQQNTVRMQMNQDSAYSAPVTTTNDSYANYNAQLSQAQGTPESGPKESLFIAFVLAFVALLGWKFLRTIRS